MKRGIIGVAIAIGSFALTAQANLIPFDLLGDTALYSVLDDHSTGVVSRAGITVTVIASEGVLNRTTSGFGINGPGSDDTDALNTGQSLELRFDQDVVFENLNVSSWNTSTDSGEVRLDDGEIVLTKGAIAGTGDTVFDFEVKAGERVIIAAVNTLETNGFSVDGFTVRTIPEPAAIGLIATTGFMILIIRRWV